MTEPKLLETLEAFVCLIDDDFIEIEIVEDGGLSHYTLPATELREYGIGDGDDFFIEIYDNGTGKIVPKILFGPWQEFPLQTLEQLEAQEDPW